jgi:hypothetical protein
MLEHGPADHQICSGPNLVDPRNVGDDHGIVTAGGRLIEFAAIDVEPDEPQPAPGFLVRRNDRALAAANIQDFHAVVDQARRDAVSEVGNAGSA